MSALMNQSVLKTIKLSATTPDPSPEDVAEMADELQQAAFNGVTADDIRDIMKAAVQRAKEGDRSSRLFVFEYVGVNSLKKPKVVEHRHKAVGSLAKHLDQASHPVAQLPAPVPVPPKPASPALLTVEMPSVGVLRRCVARLILAGGRTGVSTIAAEIEAAVPLVTEICDHEWFHTTSEGVDLTPIGRQAVG